MTITLWGRRNSANVQKISWALAELERDYEHVPLGGAFGGLDDPAYLALNPNGKVPALRDGDLVIWESHSILRYLTATYASGLLWPTEPRDRVGADEWTDWNATAYQPAWITVFWNLVRTPEDRRNHDLIASGTAETIRLQRILDQHLAKVPYLAGNEFTYADIAVGVSLYRWFTMPIERPSLPNFEAWYERLKARKAFQQTVCVSYDELKGREAF